MKPSRAIDYPGCHSKLLLDPLEPWNHNRRTHGRAMHLQRMLDGDWRSEGLAPACSRSL